MRPQSKRLGNKSDECHFILKKYFKHESFRENQLKTILHTIEGGDSLVVMATGSGKSLCYQIPPIVCHKAAIVISPLVSLIQNQVQSLQSKGIASIGFTGALKSTSYDYIEAFENNTYSVIYITPEGLPNKLHHLQRLRTKHGICCIAIDESHCVSEWGHDFRPLYKQLHVLRDTLPNVPILALTATATARVQNDIAISLKLGQFGHCLIQIISTFNRTNLKYHIKPKKHQIESDLCWLQSKEYYASGSTIIYTVTQKLAQRIADLLIQNGINASAYHAGIRHKERSEIQSKWERNEIQCIVATIAFGMGIDKNDIRYVIHYGVPDSIEAYYQQTGRAGRDGQESKCVLFWSESDFTKADWRANNTQSEQYQKKIVQQTACMKQFIHSRECRVKYILRYFGEEFGECHERCDNCSAKEKNKRRGNQKQIAKDFSNEARFLVRACYEMKERFGINAIVDFAKGKDTKSTQKIYNRQSLESFGKLQKYTNNWIKALSRKVIEFGFLKEIWTKPSWNNNNNNSSSSYKVRGFKKICVTEKGRALIGGKCSVPEWIPDNDMLKAEKEQKTSTSASNKWRFNGIAPTPTKKTKVKSSSTKWTFNNNNKSATLKRSHSQMKNENENIFIQRAAKRRKIDDDNNKNDNNNNKVVETLKEKLIVLRKKIAGAKGLIAYQVINNDAIDILCKYRVTEMDHLRTILSKESSAVLNTQFCTLFIKYIAKYCDENSLCTDVGFSVVDDDDDDDDISIDEGVNENVNISIPEITQQSREIYESFACGESINDIVRKRVISRTKIEQCLANMMINGFKLDFNRLPLNTQQTDACFDVLSAVGVSAAYDVIRKRNELLLSSLSDSQIDLLIARFIAQYFKPPSSSSKNHGKKWSVNDDDSLWKERDECILILAKKYERTQTSIMGRLSSLRDFNHKNHVRLKQFYGTQIAQKDIICNGFHSSNINCNSINEEDKIWNVQEDLCVFENRDCCVDLLANHFCVQSCVIKQRLMDLSGVDYGARYRMKQFKNKNHTTIKQIVSTSSNGMSVVELTQKLDMKSDIIETILHQLTQSFEIYKNDDRFFTF